MLIIIKISRNSGHEIILKRMLSRLFILSIFICLYVAVSILGSDPDRSNAHASLIGIDGEGNAVEIAPDDPEQSARQLLDSYSLTSASSSMEAVKVTEQARIDTVLRVFSLLPPSELDSYLPDSAAFVNGKIQIQPGTPEAKVC